MSPIDLLVEAASSSVDGIGANEALWNAREDTLEMFGRATGYEMVVRDDPEETWADFLQNKIPRLIRYLETKRETIPGGRHVRISVWRRSRLYLFDGPSFWAAVARIEGCAVEELIEKVLRASRPLLGPGPKASA
jgi:hypothetical protein